MFGAFRLLRCLGLLGSRDLGLLGFRDLGRFRDLSGLQCVQRGVRGLLVTMSYYELSGGSLKGSGFSGLRGSGLRV